MGQPEPVPVIIYSSEGLVNLNTKFDKLALSAGK